MHHGDLERAGRRSDHAAHAAPRRWHFQCANDRLTPSSSEGCRVRTRVGLHIGDAVVGNIGSEDRMNYTALGAT